MAPDPGQVHTAAELTVALKELVGGRSYAELDRAARPDRLPKGTLADMFGKGRPSEETLEVFLRACGVPREERLSWRQARERALTADPGLDGLIRVAQADPRRLGVHAPIDAPGATEDLPVYVRRDADDDPRGVRALVGQAAERGGLVVLVGGSSVGKTRCAYEAIRELLPQWWLLHPADARQIEQAASAGPERLVVWLDELQRYFDGSHPLTAATVRTLLHRHTVLIATVWPDRYITYTLPPEPGRPDPHAHARELLGLAEVVRLDAQLSRAEEERAHAVAEAGDARIKMGLESSDYGLFQVIAAAPQLIDRWHGADAYAAAVLMAAVDATRLGMHSPLSAELLREAAPGYCDARQRGNAPANWFEASLAYLTQELHGAAAVLVPVALPGMMGHPAGYVLADYLQQHLGTQRRRAKVPSATWRALSVHLSDPDDRVRTCVAALDRLLYDYVLSSLPPPGHIGDWLVGLRLADLLVRREREDEAIALLHARAEASDWHASERLVGLLVEYEQVDEALAFLGPRADAGDYQACEQLAKLLAEQGRVGELRARADAGDYQACEQLANLLAEQGRVGELRARADAGDWHASEPLAKLLAEQGQEDELRARADAGDWHAYEPLAKLLAEQGRAEEAIAILRNRSDARAVTRLAKLLVEQGEAEEAITIMRIHADDRDDSYGARVLRYSLASLLAEHGQVEEAITILRDRADADDLIAGNRLADLLAKHAREDELRARANVGDWYASERLAHLLAEQGREDELRARADAGDWLASERLAHLLAEQGRVEELRARVDAGDGSAAVRLANALMRAGRVKEAEQVHRFGLPLEDD